MTTPQPADQWMRDAATLKKWYLGYLAPWALGWILLIAGQPTEVSLSVLLASIIPYIGCIVFAYRVQNGLNKAGLVKSGAWQVIVGAILFNPIVIGWAIPTSVLWAARKAKRQAR